MKWTYDPAVDALTILFLEGRASALTREVGIGLLWDFDRNGHPVSIEILDASTHFPVRQLNKLAQPDDMIPLSEAAKRIGLDVSTLRHQIRNKRLRATKRHREWWVKASDIEAYLDNRAPQGRRGENERHRGDRIGGLPKLSPAVGRLLGIGKGKNAEVAHDRYREKKYGG